MIKMLGALLHMLGKAAEAAEAAEDDAALRKWVCAMEQIVQVEYEVHTPPHRATLAPVTPLRLLHARGGGGRVCTHQPCVHRLGSAPP